jgi:hypothetical protein
VLTGTPPFKIVKVRVCIISIYIPKTAAVALALSWKTSDVISWFLGIGISTNFLHEVQNKSTEVKRKKMVCFILSSI